MAEARKVIITCAVTGAIHTPTMSPYLPITPEEIADAAVGAAEAGAAIVHLHARDPVDGRPTQDPKLFRSSARHQASLRVVINFTTGGAATMTIEERLQPALQLKPEVASLNMGSMNFGLYPMLGRYKEFKHDVGARVPRGVRDAMFKNTFKDIANILKSCANNDTRFEIECYDIGHLYTARAFPRPRLVKPPLFIQSVFGIRGGIGAASGRRDAHEAHRRPAVRRPVPLEGARRRPQPDADRRAVGRDGRQRARRARGQPVARPRQAGRVQRRAGARVARDHRGARARGRHAR